MIYLVIIPLLGIWLIVLKSDKSVFRPLTFLDYVRMFERNLRDLHRGLTLMIPTLQRATRAMNALAARLDDDGSL